MKACKNCRFFVANYDSPKCGHPEAALKDYINGTVEMGYCTNARMLGKCGDAGALFEARAEEAA
jgi:hypothetical protein